MTVLRYYGGFFVLAGLALCLPPWFGANPAVAALSVVGGLTTIGLGIYLFVTEGRVDRPK